MSHRVIAQALERAGIVWHACGECGLPWPFPMGIPPEVNLQAHEDREWKCHRCVERAWAQLARAQASP